MVGCSQLHLEPSELECEDTRICDMILCRRVYVCCLGLFEVSPILGLKVFLHL